MFVLRQVLKVYSATAEYFLQVMYEQYSSNYSKACFSYFLSFATDRTTKHFGAMYTVCTLYQILYFKESNQKQHFFNFMRTVYTIPPKCTEQYTCRCCPPIEQKIFQDVLLSTFVRKTRVLDYGKTISKFLAFGSCGRTQAPYCKTA